MAAVAVAEVFTELVAALAVAEVFTESVAAAVVTEVFTEWVAAALVPGALVVVVVVIELLITNGAADCTASFGVTGCELLNKFPRRSSWLLSSSLRSRCL